MVIQRTINVNLIDLRPEMMLEGLTACMHRDLSAEYNPDKLVVSIETNSDLIPKSGEMGYIEVSSRLELNS